MEIKSTYKGEQLGKLIERYISYDKKNCVLTIIIDRRFYKTNKITVQGHGPFGGGYYKTKKDFLNDMDDLYDFYQDRIKELKNGNKK